MRKLIDGAFKIYDRAWPYVKLSKYLEMQDEFESLWDALYERDTLIDQLMTRLHDVAGESAFEGIIDLDPEYVASLTDENGHMLTLDELHHVPYTEEDHAICQMDTDGCIDPSVWGQVREDG